MLGLLMHGFECPTKLLGFLYLGFPRGFVWTTDHGCYAALFGQLGLGG